MPTLNRRDFLKALGLTSGASALSACGLDENRYPTPIESILPYVVKPEQVVPGTYTFFATTVTRGPHAHPVTARHRDGRVTFISANHGVGAVKAPGGPSIPTSAMFELQKHYSPDRLKGPTEGGAAITWQAAQEKLAAAVSSARSAGKQVAYVGGYKSGAIARLIGDFTGGRAIYWEADGYGALAAASKALFGSAALPYYGLDKARFVLSFGAPFLSGWGDGGIEGRFADAKNPNLGNTIARFACVAPHRDQTAAKADDFYFCTPGAEVKVARAVAGLVAARKGASDELKALIGSVSAADAAAASGLTEAQITAIAESFAADDGVALPGGIQGSSDLAAATYLLNLAAGAAPERFHLGGYAGAVSTQEELQGLIDDMAAGRVGVLLVDDVNLAYALPASAGVAAALGKVDLLVSLAGHADETTGLAKLSLPVSDAIEDWGDEEPLAGVHLLRQPAMTPLHDTVSLGDLLLTVGRAAGLGAPAAETETEGGGAAAPAGLGFSPASWRAYLMADWQERVLTGGDFQTAWEQSLMHGFARSGAEPTAPALSAASYAWAGGDAVGNGDLYLHVHAHPFRKDGRYANQPWAQEVPDPMTGIVWDSWLEVGTGLAAKLGLAYKDEVEVTTDAGTAKLGVMILPSLPDDVVALAAGQGHTASGRYADGYGVNAFALLPKGSDAGATFGATKVSIRKTGATSNLVTAFSIYGTSDMDRNFGVSVSAEKLAKVGDAEAHHAGELTGIAHLPMDKRLEEQGITDFYAMPDHPTYRFGLTVDTNACSGCGACSVACYAENNLPIVGKRKVGEGREMGWIRINRFWEADGDIHFVPMMCQQCGRAGCENVCPVLATYHTIDGLNAMVYNRCAGTRYCSNACPYPARKFNYHTYVWPEPFNLQLNPDVSVREMGVMEKCTFCVQRIRSVKSAYKDGGNFTRTVPDAALEQLPACVEACPSQALTFGNLKDEQSKVTRSRKSARSYEILADLNPASAVNYLAKASFHHDPTLHHGGGHGEEHAATAEGHAAGGDAHGGGHAAGGDAHGGEHAAAEGHGAAPEQHHEAEAPAQPAH